MSAAGVGNSFLNCVSGKSKHPSIVAPNTYMEQVNSMQRETERANERTQCVKLPNISGA